LGKRAVIYENSSILQANKELATYNENTHYDRLLSVLRYLPDGIIVTGLDGKIIYVNKATEELTGYSFKELLGIAPDILNAEEKAAEIQQQIVINLQQGKSYQGDILQRRKDGSTYYAELEMFPVYESEGKIVAWASIQRNISKRRAAENKLRQSEEYSRMLIEQIQEALIVLSPEGKYIDANQAACEMLGYEYPELLKIDMLDVTPPESVNKTKYNLVKAKINKSFFEEIIMRKDKTRFPAEINASVMTDGNYIGIIRDISERKKTEKILQEHREQLRRQLVFAKALNNLAEVVIGSKDTNEIVNSMMTIIRETLEDELKVQLLNDDLFSENPRFFSTENLIFYPFSCRDNGYYGLTLEKVNKKKKLSQKELEFIDSAAKLVEIAIQKNEYIGERAKAIDTLCESEEKYRHLVENSNDIIYTIDLNGNFLSLNKAGLETFGYLHEEVSHIAVKQIIHPRYLNQCLNTLSELLMEDCSTVPYRVLSLTKDGREVWLEFTARLMKKNGIPVEIQGIARDITQRMKMEEAMKKAEQEKDLILSSISELVVYHDINMNIKWANTSVEDFFGIAVDDMLGRHCYEIWHGRSTPCQHCPVVKTLETGEMHKKEMLSPSGTIASIKSYPVNDQDGNVIGVVEISKDITQSKQMEKEMARLDRLNLIGEMAASFGHEIRNPMSTVRGFLQMLSGKIECSAFKDYFNLMIEELDRANSIISDYLSLAKDKPIELKTHNLNSIIESLFPLILADALHHNKTIDLQLSEIPDLLIDKKEIHQLIINLVRNGLEAMTEGSVLTLATYQAGEETVLEVQDQGEGIDPSIFSRLGMPFVTTKENGTGLGLPVCYSIAERHNASIEVDTSPRGTTFFVRFKLTNLSPFS